MANGSRTAILRYRHKWCKENNLLLFSVSKTCVETQSVGKDKVQREMNLFRDAQEKTVMDR